MTVAQVLDLVARGGRPLFCSLQGGLGALHFPVEVFDFDAQLPDLAHPRQHAGLTAIAATAQDAVAGQQISARSDEGTGRRSAIATDGFFQRVDAVHVPEQAIEEGFVSGARGHVTPKRTAEGHEALRRLGLPLADDEHAAAGTGLAERFHRRQRPPGAVDHEGVAHPGQRRFDGALVAALDIHQIAEQATQPVTPGAAFQQVAGRAAEVFPALDQLRQRLEAGALGLAEFSLVAQGVRAAPQLGGALGLALHRFARALHQGVAFGQQVAQTGFERLLRIVHAGRFALLDFVLLVAAAQAAVDLGTAIGRARQAILQPGDGGQMFDECAVRSLPLTFEGPQAFFGSPGLGLGHGDRLSVRFQGGRHGAQFIPLSREVLFGLAQLVRQALGFPLSRFDRLSQRSALAAPVIDLAFELLDLAAQVEQPLGLGHHGSFALFQLQPVALDGGLLLTELGLTAGQGVAEFVAAASLGLDVLQQLRALIVGEGELEQSLGLPQALVARRLLGLALDGGDLPLDLAEHVGDAQQVLLRRLELALGLPASRLVLADARGLFDQDAAFFGAGGNDLRDAPLLDDGVAPGPDPGVPEEVEDVPQTAGDLVDQVLGLAAAVEAPGDLDLAEGGEGRRRRAVAVVEGEDHLGHAHGRAPLGAREDHVLHALAAQPAGRLLAHHPAHGVHHVRLAAAVGADDGGDPAFEAEGDSVDEALEAEDL